jgi:D-glycero-D-manno-heptose 1,7-bisphosphate phosphatase
MSIGKPVHSLTTIKYVFLDRDGVINRKRREGEYVTRWEEFDLLPGVAGAIASLNRSGYKVIVVTNQRGIALGLMTEAELGTIHDRLRGVLAREDATIDAIYYCPHTENECHCRKPQTGMLEAAFRDFPGASPENSVLIGDSLSDIECGRRIGMTTIFVEGEESRESADLAKKIADVLAASLSDAVRLILSKNETNQPF